jgi:CheY-like chemotaxis protein
MNKVFLLVDDDRDDSDLFREALGEIDPEISCYAAENGREAFRILPDIPKPDLIFMDINMPIMDGWQCLGKLKENAEYSDIPVIMYSTSSHQREIDQATALGAINFISKPDSYSALKAMLTKVADEINGK